MQKAAPGMRGGGGGGGVDVGMCLLIAFVQEDIFSHLCLP